MMGMAAMSRLTLTDRTQELKAERLARSRMSRLSMFELGWLFFFFFLFVFLGRLSNLASFDKALEWIIYIMVMRRSGFPGSLTLDGLKWEKKEMLPLWIVFLF
jgi:hypothetical protein